MGVFNSKNFNSEVFGKYLETVPRVKQNAFLKAGILRGRADIASMLAEHVRYGDTFGWQTSVCQGCYDI